jgi:hypothetical protein
MNALISWEAAGARRDELKLVKGPAVEWRPDAGHNGVVRALRGFWSS